MPFPKMEITRDIGDAQVGATLDLKPVQGQTIPQTLSFEVWFYVKSGAAPLLLVNPSLDITLYRRVGQSGYQQQSGVRLPITTGDLGHTGGFLAGEAMIWRPFAYLPAELILRIDALRDAEHGLHAEMRLNAGIVSLASAPRRPGEPAIPLAAKPFPWHVSFPVTNDLWRELLTQMGWPTPRMFELHPLSFSSLAEFEGAAIKLKEAERHLFLGNWGESVGISRIVVEAVFRKLGYKDKKPFNWNTIIAAGLPTEMSDIFRALNSVANHEHHPTGVDPRWERADARFMLQLAASLAEYAGTLPPRIPPAPPP